MQNAIAANRHADRNYRKPSRRQQLRNPVMLNLIQHLLIQHLQIRIHSADSESSSEWQKKLRVTKKVRITQSKSHRHAEHGYVHPPRRMHLWQTAMQTAFMANHHAERSCGKLSCRTQLRNPVMLNLIQHLLIQLLQIRIHSADSESSSEWQKNSE